MGKALYSNDASSLLAASIDTDDTAVQVAADDGDLFPSPSSGNYFMATLVNDDGDREIVKCTSRSGDILTVVRGQEGTTAMSFTNGQARVELRLTKGVMENLLQRADDTLLGDIDANGHELQDARLTGDTVVEGGILVGTRIRGDENDDTNEIFVPSGGGRPTLGGAEIATWNDLGGDSAAGLIAVNMVLMWYGAIVDIPVGFQVCDGTNGTPDLRNKFVVGAGGTYALNATGGATTVTGTMGAAGAHSHGGATEDHQLTVDEMPEHGHDAYVSYNGRSAGGGDPGMYSSGIFGAGYVTDDPHGSGNPMIKPEGGSDGHSHTITAEANHTHSLSSLSCLPPFRALYFIMRVE